MPTLSPVCRARKLPGAFSLTVLPHTAVARSGSPQRVPLGLDTGSYTSSAGRRQLFRGAPLGPTWPAALTRTGTELPGLLLKPKELFHDWQPTWLRWPL